jgi:hypothetical protein
MSQTTCTTQETTSCTPCQAFAKSSVRIPISIWKAPPITVNVSCISGQIIHITDSIVDFIRINAPYTTSQIHFITRVISSPYFFQKSFKEAVVDNTISSICFFPSSQNLISCGHTIFQLSSMRYKAHHRSANIANNGVIIAHKAHIANPIGHIINHKAVSAVTTHSTPPATIVRFEKRTGFLAIKSENFDIIGQRLSYNFTRIGLKVSQIVSCNSFIAPFIRSVAPFRLSILILAFSVAEVFSIAFCISLNFCAPVSAIQEAARSASVPKIVLRVAFFCSSESHFVAVLNISDMSDIDFIFPEASKN